MTQTSSDTGETGTQHCPECLRLRRCRAVVGEQHHEHRRADVPRPDHAKERKTKPTATTNRICGASTGSETLVGMLRFPWGTAGGMGFWGLRGPRRLFFLCFLVSAGGFVFFLGFLCCWCWTLRELSPLRKLSFEMNRTFLKTYSTPHSWHVSAQQGDWLVDGNPLHISRPEESLKFLLQRNKGWSCRYTACPACAGPWAGAPVHIKPGVVVHAVT